MLHIKLGYTFSHAPGYDTQHAGSVISLRKAMPWYSFKTEKQRTAVDDGLEQDTVPAPPV